MFTHFLDLLLIIFGNSFFFCIYPYILFSSPLVLCTAALVSEGLTHGLVLSIRAGNLPPTDKQTLTGVSSTFYELVRYGKCFVLITCSATQAQADK